MTTPVATPILAVYAKVVVACTLVLIFLGGLVTSWQAGMAVPDWPLSFGSLNPEGWWADLPVRLEHGHRQFAAFVGLLTTILCAGVWRNGWPLLWGALASFGFTLVATWAHIAPLILMHISIWSFAGVFAVTLLFTGRRRYPLPPVVRWIAFAAFIGVALQATFGGLRVTTETAARAAEGAGNLDLAAARQHTALVLRIVHGCVAQAQLCILVSLAALLSPVWHALAAAPQRSSRGLRVLAWSLVGVVYMQLIFGATMRHLNAGLAIPTFPQAAPDGSWMPHAHNVYIDTNFTHTRFGALLVTVLAITLAVRTLRTLPAAPRLTRPAWLLLALVAVQVTLGIFVIWHLKPPTLTTFHVLNGAAVLATSLLLALRLQRVAYHASPAAGAALVLATAFFQAAPH